jgi:hypothetical protein
VEIYRSQLKARIQLSGESLQGFAPAVEQLAHRALVGLPLDFIQREAAHAVIHGVKYRELKHHLIMGSDEALKLEAAKVAARTPARLTMTGVTSS